MKRLEKEVTAGPENNFGKLVSEHKTTAKGFRKVALLMLFGLASGSGLLGLAIFSDASNIGGRVIMGIFGLLFLLVPVLGVYGLVRGRDNAIRIHENGIAIHKLGVDTALLWDDIATYDDGAFLTLGTNDDQSFDFGMDGLRGGSEIISKLRDEVTMKRAVPRMMATLREGKAGELVGDGEKLRAAPEAGVVEVPGFIVDVDGITALGSDELTPWKSVTSCRVEEKSVESGRVQVVLFYVVVSTASGKYRAIMNSRSNREAMLGLCSELRKEMIGG